MKGDKARNDLNREATAAASLLDALRDADFEIAHDTINGETGLFEAISFAIAEIDDKEAIIAGSQAKVEQYTKRKRDAEGRIGRLRGLIEQAMAIAELKTVRLPEATLTVSELAPKAIIENEAEIPSEFWEEQPPKLDKKKLNEHVANGDIPRGVTKSNGTTSLKIRRA